MKNAALVHALAEELNRAPAFQLQISGAELLQIVSFLQLALRHPSLDAEQACATLYVRGFIASAREGFGGFPTVQLVIDSNNGHTEVPRPC